MTYLTAGIDAGTPVRLYYEDNRAPGTTGDPVVLIHGWLQSGRTWEAQVEALVADGHRVITYDRRGFGQSSMPWGGYNFDVFAADLDAVLTHLDLHDVTLVGFSNGGGDVARYLGTFGSGRVSKAVFASATPPFIYWAPGNPAGRLTDDVISYLQNTLRADRPAFIDHMVSDMFTPTGGEELVSKPTHDYAAAIALSASPKGTIDCVEAWKTDFRADLAAIDIPTLILHGDSDHVLPVDATGRRTHDAVKDSTLVLIPGGPHAICTTHPQKFNAALVAFLAA